jgi:hypothetical protein
VGFVGGPVVAVLVRQAKRLRGLAGAGIVLVGVLAPALG